MICLDTDVMSAIVRPGGGPLQLARKLGVLDASEQCTTAITVGELVYGARKRQNAQLESDIGRALAEVQVQPFEEAAARVFAEIRVRLESQGQRLDDPDLRIAAICLANDLTLVTGNVRHFERVPGLRVENWLE